MAVTKICVAPFDALALAVDPPLALTLSVLFAALAEGLIEADYLAKRPGKIFVDHYFDNPITASYIAFLASHNPHLRTRILRTMYDSRTIHAREVFDEITQAGSEQVLRTFIRRTVKFADAAASGASILQHTTDSDGTD